MKIKELREKSEKELQTLLKENREKLRELEFDLVARKLKNPKEISRTRKNIARILTILMSRKPLASDEQMRGAHMFNVQKTENKK